MDNHYLLSLLSNRQEIEGNSYQMQATVAARQRFVVFCILSAWLVSHSTWDHQTSRRVGHFYTVLCGLVEFADSSSLSLSHTHTRDAI